MAGVSTKDIKNRIRSMESTKQITKAMEMVAASKLRHAQAQVTASRPYFEILYATIQDIVAHNSDFSSPYLAKRNGNKALYVVIAGDRGLAGGYNSNILKMVMADAAEKDATILPIGKKAIDFFRSRKMPMLSENHPIAAEVSIGDCFSVARLLCKAYLSGEFDAVYVAYTNFVSVLSQTLRCCNCCLWHPEAPVLRKPWISSTNPMPPRFLTASFRNIWAVRSMAPCAKAAPPSRLPVALQWTPPPRMPRT